MASWNLRGVNKPFKQRELRSFILKYKIPLIGLNETRVLEENHYNIAAGLMPGWRFITNYSYHYNGRVWVLWDPSILDITTVCMTDQMIHVAVTVIQSQTKFSVSFIYAQNDYILRRALWNHLRLLSQSCSQQPWLVLGDFNVVRKDNERQGGAQDWHPYMDEFNECCCEASLEDLRYIGCHLTWSKGSGEGYIARKLDRALVNSSWFSAFPDAFANFLERGPSDHSPILVDFRLQQHIRKPPFRFFNFWISSPAFEANVHQIWHSSILGSPQFVLSQKLKLVKGFLKTLNKNQFSDIQQRTEAARENLFQIQKLMQNQPGNVDLLYQEKAALHHLVSVSAAEESFFRQKSRVLWIKEGDQNSKFFHGCLKDRVNSNKITSLTLEDGI